MIESFPPFTNENAYDLEEGENQGAGGVDAMTFGMFELEGMAYRILSFLIEEGLS